MKEATVKRECTSLGPKTNGRWREFQWRVLNLVHYSSPFQYGHHSILGEEQISWKWGKRAAVRLPQNHNKSRSDSNKKTATETYKLYGRLLDIIIHERTVQLICALLSTVLVRVDVQSDHQNQHYTNRYTEDRYHHYDSFQFMYHYMWTRIPQFHTPTHTHPHSAFHHTPWAFYSLYIIILIHMYWLLPSAVMSHQLVV